MRSFRSKRFKRLEQAWWLLWVQRQKRRYEGPDRIFGPCSIQLYTFDSSNLVLILNNFARDAAEPRRTAKPAAQSLTHIMLKGQERPKSKLGVTLGDFLTFKLVDDVNKIQGFILEHEDEVGNRIFGRVIVSV